MKDIKTFVIGFLTCACVFLIMGQTNGEDKMEMNLDGKVILGSNENGRYQISTLFWEGFPSILETIIDTRTGEIFKREKVKLKQYKK